MSTTQTISSFFEKRKLEKHYSNLPKIPSNLNKDEALKWIINDCPIKSLRLDINIPFEDMYNEACALLDDFYEHRSDGESHAGWKSLVLHGRGKHITQGDDQYDLSTLPEMHWTEVADACPKTTYFIKNILPLDQFLRVRFMLLEPGGYVMPHCDNNNNKLQAFNIALNNPEGCMFGYEGSGLIPWKPGDVRMINIGSKHAVWNNSNTPRIHMIVHGWAKDKYRQFRDSMLRGYEQICESYT
jgi:hypothetical protein